MDEKPPILLERSIDDKPAMQMYDKPELELAIQLLRRILIAIRTQTFTALLSAKATIQRG